MAFLPPTTLAQNVGRSGASGKMHAMPTIATSTAPRTDGSYQGLTFSDKSYRYLLAAQLALAQWPGSLLGALTGWVVGYAWRMEALPRPLTRWRIPGWIVGVRAPRRSEEFEGMRRRLEGEGALPEKKRRVGVGVDATKEVVNDTKI